jgi:hypothetical protein
MDHPLLGTAWRDRQLFFFVCAMNLPTNCDVTFVPLQCGQAGVAIWRSEIVMTNSKDLLNFSQRNS